MTGAVVGQRKGGYRQGPHRFRVDHGMAYQISPHEIVMQQSIRRAAGCVYGHALVLAQLIQRTDVIRVLVGDENGAYRR